MSQWAQSVAGYRMVEGRALLGCSGVHPWAAHHAPAPALPPAAQSSGVAASHAHRGCCIHLRLVSQVVGARPRPRRPTELAAADVGLRTWWGCQAHRSQQTCLVGPWTA